MSQRSTLFWQYNSSIPCLRSSCPLHVWDPKYYDPKLEYPLPRLRHVHYGQDICVDASFLIAVNIVQYHVRANASKHVWVCSQPETRRKGGVGMTSHEHSLSGTKWYQRLLRQVEHWWNGRTNGKREICDSSGSIGLKVLVGGMDLQKLCSR